MGTGTRTFAGAIALAAALMLAPAAQATPPTLNNVSEDPSAPGVLTADWTLPDGMFPDTVEVAVSPKTTPGFGDFIRNVVLDFPTTATTWRASSPLPPGTYYVHVGAIDTTKCQTGTEPECTILEYSNYKSITIPGAAPTPPAAPVLDSVGYDPSRHLTVSWTVAAGTESDFIEVATAPDHYTEGDFLNENTVLLDYPFPGSSSFVSSEPLAPGTYYVHVSAFDPSRCTNGTEPACLTDSFSDVLSVTIPPDAPPAGGSGSQATTPPAPKVIVDPASAFDKTTAFASLKAAKKQDVDKLVVVASMGEAGTITAGGSVSVPALSKVYGFKPVSAQATAGASVKLKLKLPKKALKAVKKALKRHKKLKAKLTITARDRAGNAKTESRTVALKA